MGSADRSLLSLAVLSTFFLPSFPPSFLPSFCPSLPSPTKSHNLFPRTVGPETDSTRGQIYLHQHEVKHLKHLVTVAGPCTAGEMRSVIYICWGSSKGQLTYISTTGDSVCMSQKIALTSHIQLESQNFLIP